MSGRRQIARYLWPLIAIIAMAVLAGAVALYVLSHQRVHFPWQNRYSLNIELASAQAITPGQGQTIDVAGVAVGSIESVTLRNGLAVVRGAIDPDKLPRVYANATALVRPKTGLQDMVVEIDPGHAPAPKIPHGGTIGVARTLPQVNLDEVLGSLDADTRDYLRALLAAGAGGLHGRGLDVRRLFKATEPTLKLTQRATQAIADRQAKVQRLVTNLRILSEATASKDTELASLIDSSDAALRAVADQDAALRSGIGQLPATVVSARRALASAAPLSRELGPTLNRLLPAVRRLGPALDAAAPLVRDATPQLGDVYKLVTTGQPVLRDLNPTTADLNTDTPDLTRSFRVLRYVVNELAYNPPGSEEGYLFWLAWFNHNANSLLSEGDAHGLLWRGQLMMSCSTLANANESGALGTLLGALGSALPCPTPPAGGAAGNGGSSRKGGH